MAKKLAFASVMTALTAVCLCASVLLPTGRMTFLMLASFTVLVAHAECGTRLSVLSYAAAAIIGLLFLPIKLSLLLFIVFMGYYPIVKGYVERLDNLFWEWVTKILFFSAVLVAIYFIARYLLLPSIEMGVVVKYIFAHIPTAVLIAEIIFVIYDILLSGLASYYINIVKPRIQNNR